MMLWSVKPTRYRSRNLLGGINKPIRLIMKSWLNIGRLELIASINEYNSYAISSTWINLEHIYNFHIKEE